MSRPRTGFVALKILMHCPSRTADNIDRLTTSASRAFRPRSAALKRNQVGYREEQEDAGEHLHLGMEKQRQD